jgi:hypothetical protein
MVAADGFGPSGRVAASVVSGGFAALAAAALMACAFFVVVFEAAALAVRGDLALSVPVSVERVSA